MRCGRCNAVEVLLFFWCSYVWYCSYALGVVFLQCFLYVLLLLLRRSASFSFASVVLFSCSWRRFDGWFRVVLKVLHRIWLFSKEVKVSKYLICIVHLFLMQLASIWCRAFGKTCCSLEAWEDTFRVHLRLCPLCGHAFAAPTPRLEPTIGPVAEAFLFRRAHWD